MTAGGAGQKSYLGDRLVVGSLVASYCEKVRDMIVQRSAGTLEASEFSARVGELGVELSTIFSGRDPAYKAIIGWNSISLGAHLRVALKTYWSDHRATLGDDPIRVLFAWLCWAVLDSAQRADGDEDLEGLMLAEHTRVVIRLLLGSDSATRSS